MVELPPADTLQIRVPAMAAQTNYLGDVFGGWIMSQVDIGASIPAVERCGGKVVTVAVNRFEFHKPVSQGDMVNIYARVVTVGTTSMTVAAEVFVERPLPERKVLKVADAEIVYVAVDESGRPMPVNGRSSVP